MFERRRDGEENVLCLTESAMKHKGWERTQIGSGWLQWLCRLWVISSRIMPNDSYDDRKLPFDSLKSIRVKSDSFITSRAMSAKLLLATQWNRFNRIMSCKDKVQLLNFCKFSSAFPTEMDFWWELNSYLGIFSSFPFLKFCRENLWHYCTQRSRLNSHSKETKYEH